MISTTHSNGLSDSQHALTVLDSGLKWFTETKELASKLLEEGEALQKLNDTAQLFRDYMSKIGDGVISVLGRQKTNTGPNKVNEAMALSGKGIAPPMGLTNSFNINYIPEGFTGSSALGNEFTTASVTVSADTADNIASTVQETTQDMNTIAEQDFVAYVLQPEILDEKLKQDGAEYTSEAREQFTNATLEQQGIVRLPDGSIAISQEQLETLRGQFTQAGNGTELNTPNNEATAKITTYEYTGETSTTAFNPVANGQEPASMDITDPDFKLLPELALDAPA